MGLHRLFSGFPQESLLVNEPLCAHTSFAIGGPADLLVIPQTKEQFCAALDVLRGHSSVPYFILGNGSNVLAPDAGYRGVVLKTTALSSVDADGCALTVGAGATLAKAAAAAMNEGLAGLEFASGIPGTLGGAVCMNAGAYDGEIKDVLTTVEVIDASGAVRTLTNEQAGFSYRDSKVLRDGMIVLGATFALTRGDREEIKSRARQLNERRREKQPLEYPSAGSTFKRPQGHYAGRLIQDGGLAGYAVGGAMVSPKHCGFVINTGGATAADVLRLIAHVKAVVKEKFDVDLEPEVRFMSEVDTCSW